MPPPPFLPRKREAGGGADRDFELTWTAAAEKTPSVGVFREQVAGSDYLLAYVTPPAVNDAEQKPLPREVIFVIDNSGSMGGTSIVQAKASLLYALGRLQPNDRFNVIRFDHTMDMLFPDVVAADSDHLAQAKAFVTALQAAGGTEMIPPMRAALTDRQADGNTVRQVVFLTDGCIGNEQQLFDTITSMRGRSRVFMVGIGSAPNSYLMTRAAELGRGTFTHIGSVEQVESRMRELFGKLESPAVTQLSVTFSDTKADMTPVVLPDLYRGEPLVLAAKLGKLAGTMEIKGRIGDRPWSVTLPLANAAEGRGLSKLWARRKITDAEVAQTLRTLTADEANKTILALALEHQLVTRLTSLIAVDQTPIPSRRRAAQGERTAAQPAGGLGLRESLRRATEACSRRGPGSSGGRTRVTAAFGSPCGRVARGVGRQSTATGRRAAGDRHRCRVEDDLGHRADGIRADAPRASSPKGFRLMLLKRT